MLPDAPQGLEHRAAGERQDREREHQALDLPPYRLRIRPGLELSRARAPGFGEDLRRERRGSGALSACFHPLLWRFRSPTRSVSRVKQVVLHK